MARSSFQKLKLLHVMNYLLQNSDEEHPITVNQMIQYLESNGIAAERKSIYDDIEALRTFGMDIEECKRGRVFGYYVASRTFELPELKLLVDSVQSSKFITHKKTSSLIKKIKYRINRRPSQVKKLSKSGQYAAKKAEHTKSSVRAKVAAR